MKHSRNFIQACLVAILACTFFIVGCGRVSMVSSKRAEKLAQDVFHPTDANRRREAIVKISAQSWGKKDPYLEAFALVVRNDPMELVRAAATDALGNAGEMKYQPVVIEALNDPADIVRLSAAEALAKLPEDAAMKPLAQAALKDDCPKVRLASLKAISLYRHIETVRTSLAALGDADFAVRLQARTNLVDLTGIDHGYDTHRWEQVTDFEIVPPPTPKSKWWKLGE